MIEGAACYGHYDMSRLLPLRISAYADAAADMPLAYARCLFGIIIH